MPRPKNADAAATRQRILSAAARLLADHGPDGASVREIAAAAGVSAATVHHYFGTKEALVAAAGDDVWTGMHSVEKALANAIERDDDLPTLVAKSVRVAFAWARENVDANRLIMRGVVDQGGRDAAGRSDLLVPFIQHTATLLSVATDRPTPRVRLELTTVVSLIVRYAMADPTQLRTVLAVSDEQHDDAELLMAVENHLVDVAQRLLRIRPEL